MARRQYTRNDDSSRSHLRTEQLRQLEWMVGEWTDESPHAVVATSCRWDESKNFILRDYSIKVAGRSP